MVFAVMAGSIDNTVPRVLLLITVERITGVNRSPMSESDISCTPSISVVFAYLALSGLAISWTYSCSANIIYTKIS